VNNTEPVTEPEPDYDKIVAQLMFELASDNPGETVSGDSNKLARIKANVQLLWRGAGVNFTPELITAIAKEDGKFLAAVEANGLTILERDHYRLLSLALDDLFIGELNSEKQQPDVH